MKKRVNIERMDLKELNLFDKVPNFSSMFYHFNKLNELITGYFIKKIAGLIKLYRY